jgi:hypothetical protein
MVRFIIAMRGKGVRFDSLKSRLGKNKHKIKFGQVFLCANFVDFVSLVVNFLPLRARRVSPRALKALFSQNSIWLFSL